VDAAFMSLYVHDRVIHALRLGAGGAGVTGAGSVIGGCLRGMGLSVPHAKIVLADRAAVTDLV
jgi:hypothetical protein